MSELLQQSLFGVPSPERTTLATPRDRAIDWAIRMTQLPNAVYLDTETTGLGHDAEICDIAIVGPGGAALYSTLVKPTVSIPADASKIHGISDEMVAGAPGWPDVVEWVRRVLADKHVVVYNAQYDLPLINRVCARHKVEPVSTVLAGRDCAMLRFSEFIGIERWQKLDAAAAHFDLPPGGHRALADANTARLVVEAMAKAVTA